MLPRIEMLKIALAHANTSANIPLDNQGVPAFRVGYQVDLIGLFISQISYYATLRIESMTTYRLRDVGIFCEEELQFINEIDDVQTYCDPDEWVAILEEKINDEHKVYSKQRKCMMDKDKELKQLIEREGVVGSRIAAAAKELPWKAPEVLRQIYWNLFCIMADHYAASDSKGNVAYIGSLLSHLSNRLSEDPGFTKDLADKLKEDGVNLSAICPQPLLRDAEDRIADQIASWLAEHANSNDDPSMFIDDIRRGTWR